MELKRRIALSAMLLSAGLGTGHIVQTRAEQNQRQAAAAATTAPTGITPVAAGRADAAAAPAMPSGDQAAALPLSPAATAPAVPPVSTGQAPGAAMGQGLAAAADIPLASAGDAPGLAMAMAAPPILAIPAMAARIVTDPGLGTDQGRAVPDLSLAPGALDIAPTPQAAPEVATADCTAVLDLAAQDHAMIAVTLTAPCRTGERVVLRHGGLVFTARTSDTGSLFTTLPGMESGAGVTVLFGDGDMVEATVDLPDLAAYRRFGVQWLADDAFQLHAFENGADYGADGHVSAAAPHLPLAGIAGTGGFLTVLGDAGVDLPMLAEVYTWPADAAVTVDVVVEAAVSDTTCGRDLLGETLTSSGGVSLVTELTVAMPACDAMGDILVLKNLVPDMTLAANN